VAELRGEVEHVQGSSRRLWQLGLVREWLSTQRCGTGQARLCWLGRAAKVSATRCGLPEERRHMTELEQPRGLVGQQACRDTADRTCLTHACTARVEFGRHGSRMTLAGGPERER
jgi:hypothetical protein